MKYSVFLYLHVKLSFNKIIIEVLIFFLNVLHHKHHTNWGMKWDYCRILLDIYKFLAKYVDHNSLNLPIILAYLDEFRKHPTNTGFCYQLTFALQLKYIVSTRWIEQRLKHPLIDHELLFFQGV